MTGNSYITSLIQYLKAEIALAGEQVQNGSSTEAKAEARVAHDYMNTLLVQIEQEYQEYENMFFDNSRYTYSCSYEGDENDND